MAERDRFKLDIVKQCLSKYSPENADLCERYGFATLLPANKEFKNPNIYTESPAILLFIIAPVSDVYPCGPIILDDMGLFVSTTFAFNQGVYSIKIDIFSVLNDRDYSEFKKVYRAMNSLITADLIRKLDTH